MSSIFDSIQQQITASFVQQVSQRFGIDPAVAQQAINTAVPAITGALAAHARAGGADAIHREATKQVEIDNQADPFQQVLGAHHATAAQRVSDVTGVSTDDAGRIVSAIMPALMRGIGLHAQQQGMDSKQLGNALATAAADVRENPPSSGRAGEARL